MELVLNGRTIHDHQSFLNVYANFKMLSSMSPADLKSNNTNFGMAPDLDNHKSIRFRTTAPADASGLSGYGVYNNNPFQASASFQQTTAQNNGKGNVRNNIKITTNLGPVNGNRNMYSNVSSNMQPVVEEIIEENRNIPKNNVIPEKVINEAVAEVLNTNRKDNTSINKQLKFYVPKGFTVKNPCKGRNKCELTKKEICESITENFIIRNNIIAAILTTIPYENNGEYQGGICFIKMLNLNNCNVCVPLNYQDLKYIDTKDIIEDILKKADYLDKPSCEYNKGKFLALSSEEKLSLIRKAESITKISDLLIDKNKNIKYNIYYLNYLKKIKKEYFDSLNLLLDILMNMQENPIINNATLNKIGKDVNKIIDKLYDTKSNCENYV
jgi:hypothetical protein